PIPALEPLDDLERVMRLVRLDADGLTPADLVPLPLDEDGVRRIFEAWNVPSRRFEIAVNASRTSNP
ncbi:MAG: hypothetical protein KDA28_16480, partial [Phycisphaerales bacterium]|nr:hypothetical protein [Phycisphaerales bacterium]